MKRHGNRAFWILILMVLAALTITACAKKSAKDQTQAQTQAQEKEAVQKQEETTTAQAQAQAQTATKAAQTQAETAVPQDQEATTPAAFSPSELYDLVSAEAIGEFGTVRQESREALKWIEEHFSNAAKLNGWPNCPYDMIIRLTRKDGQVFEVQPATDACDNMLIGGNDWYSYNNGLGNEALFDLFDLEAKVGQVSKRAPLPKYVFPGDDGALKAVTEYFAAQCDSYKPESSVAIPECVFIKKEDDGNGNVKVYGNFWTNSYSKLGNAFFLRSGASQPGIVYLKKTGDNTYEVTKVELAETGDDMDKDIKRFCNGDNALYDKYLDSLDHSSEYTKNWRYWHLSNYIKNNNLNIEYIQQSGWEPEKITTVESMPELMK